MLLRKLHCLSIQNLKFRCNSFGKVRCWKFFMLKVLCLFSKLIFSICDSIWQKPAWTHAINRFNFTISQIVLSISSQLMTLLVSAPFQFAFPMAFFCGLSGIHSLQVHGFSLNGSGRSWQAANWLKTLNKINIDVCN